MAKFLQRYGGISIILTVFIVLGLVYSLATPIFEASDEIWHYPVVKYIADNHELLVQEIGSSQPWRQEGSQPPLYYMLAALSTFWIDTGDMTDLLWHNPHAQIGVPLASGNKNMIIHTSQEAFPYRGTTLAVHLIRVLSLLMAGGAVLLTYLIVAEVFPSDRVLASGAAAIHAFNPMFLFTAASVNNDNLAVLLCSLALLLMLRSMRRTLSPLGTMALGIVIGLATLTKLSALGLLPLSLLALTYSAFRNRSWSFFLKGCALVFPVAFALSSWWYVRNWLLYSDPLGLKMMVAIAGPREAQPTPLQLLAEFQGFKTSYWGLFGTVNILAGPYFYLFFDLISILSLVGLAIVAVRWRIERRETPISLLLFLLLWVIILLGGLMRWTQMTKASSGRLIFPALPVLSFFMALGLQGLWPPRRVYLLGLVSGTMVLIAFLSPFLYILPAYAKPSSLSEAALESIPHLVEANYGGKMTLLGYDLKEGSVRPGDLLHLTLYWRSTAVMDQDYSVSVKLFGADNLVLGQVDSYPGSGSYPTSLWKEGDAIADRYAIPIERGIKFPMAAPIEVVLYRWPTMDNLEAHDSQGRPVGRVVIGRVKITPRRHIEYLIPRPTYFDLAHQVALIGYEVDRTTVSPGETIGLTLYWQALKRMEGDYTVFAHLIDDQRQIWAQKDHQPVEGAYPTSFWGEKEVVRDEYELVVDPQAPPGRYLLEVGLYLLSTGERLPVWDEKGERQEGDRIILEEVEITLGG